MNAQEQLSTRALEMAAIANDRAETTQALLGQHITSCSRMQIAVLTCVIMLLVGMVGVLIELYVLPHSVTITDTTTITRPGAH